MANYEKMARHPERESICHMSRSNKPLVLALISMFVSIGAVSFVSVKLTTRSADILPGTVEDSVCVSCELLDDQDPMVKPLIQSLMTKVEEGDRKKCCVQTWEELQILLELVSAKAPISEIPIFVEPADRPTNGVFAHKRLFPPNETVGATGTRIMVPLHLALENAKDEISKNLIVTPHGIVVSRTGLYQICLDIKFSSVLHRCCDKDTTWHISVIMSRPKSRQQSGTILYAPHICCYDCPSELKTTAGFFQLQEGDHLHVEVTPQAVCQFDKASSFIGVFMMGT